MFLKSKYIGQIFIGCTMLQLVACSTTSSSSQCRVLRVDSSAIPKQIREIERNDSFAAGYLNGCLQATSLYCKMPPGSKPKRMASAGNYSFTEGEIFGFEFAMQRYSSLDVKSRTHVLDKYRKFQELSLDHNEYEVFLDLWDLGVTEARLRAIIREAFGSDA